MTDRATDPLSADIVWQGIDHLQLAIPTGGEDAARAFWVGAMGFAERPKPTALASRGGLWVAAPGIELHLGVELDFRPARKAHPGLRVAGIDALAARLAAAGAPVTWDDAIQGVRRFFTADPFGNRVEVIAAAVAD